MIITWHYTYGICSAYQVAKKLRCFVVVWQCVKQESCVRVLHMSQLMQKIEINRKISLEFWVLFKPLEPYFRFLLRKKSSLASNGNTIRILGVFQDYSATETYISLLGFKARANGKVTTTENQIKQKKKGLMQFRVT